MNAKDIIALLDLQRHPEGGWYRQTFEDSVPDGRAHSTLIYFLLEAGDRLLDLVGLLAQQDRLVAEPGVLSMPASLKYPFSMAA